MMEKTYLYTIKCYNEDSFILRSLDVELYREYELLIIFMTLSLPNIYWVHQYFFILHTYCKYVLKIFISYIVW